MRWVVLLLTVLPMGFAPAPVPKPRPAPRTLEADLKATQGKWRRLSSEQQGDNPTIKPLNDTVVIRGSQITYGAGEPGALTWTLALADGKPERFFDTSREGLFERGLYQLKGDTLQICYASDGSPRPSSMRPKGNLETLDILVRISP